MPTWLLFLILFIVILIIIWILLSGSPVVEEDALVVQETLEVPFVQDGSSSIFTTVEEHSAEELDENDEAVEIMEVPDEIIESDDLKKIEGIGPKISGLLAEKGIKTFSQLADSKTEEIQQILDEAKIRIANPGTWAEQAKLAAQGEWDSLGKLQDELKGGRREPK